MSTDPKIQLLAIYYNRLSERNKQRLLNYSHQLSEGQRAEVGAEQRIEDDGLSSPRP